MRLFRFATRMALPALAMTVLVIAQQGVAEAAGTSSAWSGSGSGSGSGSSETVSPRSASVNPDFFYYAKATGVEVRFYPYGERLCVYDTAPDGHHVEVDYATSNGLSGTGAEYAGNGNHTCASFDIPESGSITFTGHVMEGSSVVRSTKDSYASARNV